MYEYEYSFSFYREASDAFLSKEACQCWMGRGYLGDADTKVGMLFRHRYQQLMHRMELDNAVSA
jgi:hypothetical protein